MHSFIVQGNCSGRGAQSGQRNSKGVRRRASTHLRDAIRAARLALGLTPRQAAAESRAVRAAVASATSLAELRASVRRLEPAYVASLVAQGREARR